MKRYGKIAAFESIDCWCDRFVYDRTGNCFFLSIFGREAEVTSVMSSFIEGRDCRVDIVDDTRMYWVSRDKTSTYRVLTRKTEGILHKIAFSMDAFQGDKDRIVIADSLEGIKAEAMRFLDSSVSTPLSPEWQGLIFRWMDGNYCLEELDVFGFGKDTLAVKVHVPSEKDLENFVLSEVLSAVNDQQ